MRKILPIILALGLLALAVYMFMDFRSTGVLSIPAMAAAAVAVILIGVTVRRSRKPNGDN